MMKLLKILSIPLFAFAAFAMVLNQNGFAASFDCGKVRSYAEKTICADPVLSALDDELGAVYAKALAEITRLTDGARNAPLARWFRLNTKNEWVLREQKCRSKDCLLRWYQKRRAVLDAIVHRHDVPGITGIERLKQYENGNVTFSVAMGTHSRNFHVDVRTRETRELGDGKLTILSHDPLVYRLDGQKSYFAEGGAFWYHTIRNANRQIVDIALDSEATAEKCMLRAEFFKRTGWKKRRLAAFRGKEICRSFERGSTYCSWKALESPLKGMTPDPETKVVTLFTVGGVEAPLCNLEPVKGTDFVDITCPSAPHRNGRMEVIQYDPRDADYVITRFKGDTYFRRCSRER